MIIWLASYPKSGNTFVRSLLSSYIFSQDGNFNFELLKEIKQFPDNSLFKQLGVDIENEDEMYKNYINSQKLFNEKDLQVSKWGTIKIDFDTMETNLKGVFAAGDIVRGASLVVWAIKDGRDVAESIDKLLKSKRKQDLKVA